MELTVYTCRDDTILFVPAVCLPPSEAQATFGPLERVGSVVVGPLHSSPWRDILAQIERHLFAALPVGHALLLIDALPPGSAAPQPADT